MVKPSARTTKKPLTKTCKWLIFSCPVRARTWTFLIQSQTCYQLHHRTMYFRSGAFCTRQRAFPFSGRKYKQTPRIPASLERTFFATFQAFQECTYTLSALKFNFVDLSGLEPELFWTKIRRVANYTTGQSLYAFSLKTVQKYKIFPFRGFRPVFFAE